VLVARSDRDGRLAGGCCGGYRSDHSLGSRMADCRWRNAAAAAGRPAELLAVAGSAQASMVLAAVEHTEPVMARRHSPAEGLGHTAQRIAAVGECSLLGESTAGSLLESEAAGRTGGHSDRRAVVRSSPHMETVEVEGRNQVGRWYSLVGRLVEVQACSRQQQVGERTIAGAARGIAERRDHEPPRQ